MYKDCHENGRNLTFTKRKKEKWSFGWNDTLLDLRLPQNNINSSKTLSKDKKRMLRVSGEKIPIEKQFSS